MKVVITTHKGMDLDALGAIVAAKKLYTDSIIVLPGARGEDVNAVLRDYPDILDYVEESDSLPEDIGGVVVVDTVDIDRLPDNVYRFVNERKPRIFVYDHHDAGHCDLESAEVHYKDCGAVTSFLTMILKGKGIVPSPIEASIMALGIYSDTGSFSFPNTKPIDFLAVSYLFAVGANVEVIRKFLPKELTDREIDILKILKDSVEIVDVHGNDIAIAVAQFDFHVGDIAHLVSKLLDIIGVSAIVSIVDIGGVVFVICRSRTGRVDVSKVTSEFGGGGHREAASAAVKNMTVHEVKSKILQVLDRTVKPTKVAMDIMTSPAKVLGSTCKVKDALEFLIKNGINAAPVVDEEGVLLGIVNRKLTDKAIYMGMSDDKISDIMRTDIDYGYPEDPVEKVEDIIINKRQGLVPIVDDRHFVVGVVTRTDILTNLHRKDVQEAVGFYEKRIKVSPYVKNLSQLLSQKVPAPLFDVLKTIGSVADDVGVNAYIVGGFVRDLIIGRENLDVDIVIEGDAIAFAKRIAVVLGAKVHTFDRFKTATIITRNGFRVDIASARTELYTFPGALPSVDSASLKKDLFRRDFTINTLAIKINKNDFGKLIDFFNGLKDIREKKIRVLHSLSFIEDPTRVLRALRFAVRYRFEIGKHTEKLLKIAVQRRLFKTVEGRRLYTELKHIMEEDNPLRVINRMHDYGILQALNRDIVWDRSKKDLFERIRKVIIWHRMTFDMDVDYAVLYLAALLEGLSYGKVESFLKELSVPREEISLIMLVFVRARQVLGMMHPSMRNSQLADIMSGLPEEVLLYMAACAKDEWKREKVLEFLKKWRNVKLHVTGSDLVKLGLKPGPLFGRILKRLRDEMIDGNLTTREEQLEFVRREYIDNAVSYS